jgi:L,D-peptidoglycan transpeptidase YkuD (ErfK/YbiS/YcfS/YnhG family)
MTVLLLAGAALGIGEPTGVAAGRSAASSTDPRHVDVLSATGLTAASLLPEEVAARVHVIGPMLPAPTTPTPVEAMATDPPAPDGAAAAPSTATARRPVPAPPAATAPAPAPAPSGGTLPLPVATGSSAQVVTVVAPSARSTTAKLTAWELGPSGWTAVLGPVSARIGAAGVGAASESSTRTPAGAFTLTEAFGRAGNPGAALPYRVVDGDDWWVSDPASPRYNQYAQCAPGSCDFDEAAGEDLYAAGAVYDHAVVIDYNRGGTPGAGSAFFLHISNGAATAGCVAIDRGSLQTLLRWLDPAASPVIAIGVG